MNLYIYDSSKKEKKLFSSMEKNKVKIYICGPTVYEHAHLGHARSAVFFDLLHRVLLANDYKVTIVKNFTDIDDKIINKLNIYNKSLEELTAYYIKSYQDDMTSLNVLKNTIEPKATDNIKSMKSLVQKLLDKEYAYIINGDGIYFNTFKDEKYGKISNQIDDKKSISRLKINKNKKNTKDFVLWKFFDKNDFHYTASFGNGRPGWHCECSAMINQHISDSNLPYSVDIHGGGIDLLFPHHENEASQNRMAYNQEIAKYWLHNGFVNINGEKMSKSLGNSFFLKDALKSYNGEVIRFYMLSTHYRSDLNFNEQDLLSSKKRLDKLYRLKKRVYNQAAGIVDTSFKNRILNTLNDDFNTSKTMSYIDLFVSQSNDLLDSKKSNISKNILANINFINEIIGIGYQDAYLYFQFGVSQKLKQKIENLIKDRQEAKLNKNYSLSDKIRNDLTNLNISIMDTSKGTMWEKHNL